MATVYLSRASNVVPVGTKPGRMVNEAIEPCSFVSSGRARLATTSSLVISRPEWNCTPLRRWIVNCLPSGVCSQLSASCGCGLRSRSYVVSVSYAMKTLKPFFGPQDCGSMLATSPTAPTRRLPPVLGCAAGAAAAVGAVLAAVAPGAGAVAPALPAAGATWVGCGGATGATPQAA